MEIQNCALAPALPACPEKVTKLYYAKHQRATKPLLGAFLSPGDVKRRLVVMPSGSASERGKRRDR